MAPTDQTPALLAGTYAVDTTPRLGSHLIGGYGPRVAAAIKDPLFAKAVVVKSGETMAALVTVDLCMIERAEVDAAKQRLYERLGLTPENVLISATHTHTGPAAVGILAVDKDPWYCATLPEKIADAVEGAVQRLQPAEMVYGECQVEQVFNRRWHMKDGTVQMNPGYQNPDLVRPAGPVDETLAVLGFRCPETARPLAIYVNYPLHYVGSSPSNHVSADYFGRVDQNLRRILGVPVAVLSNGTTGDVNNCDFSQPSPQHPIVDGQAIKVAGIVACAAARVFYEAPVMAVESVKGALEELIWHPRVPEAEQLQADEVMIAEMDRLQPTMEQVKAFERLKLFRMEATQKTWVQALRIGEVAYVGLPGEIFVEYGLEIKAKSPGRTNCVELANDWIAYVPAVHAYDEGGYETWIGTACKVPPDFGPAMSEAALRLLAKVTERG